MKPQTIVLSSLALFMNAALVFGLPAPEPTETSSLEPIRDLSSSVSTPMHWTGSIEGGPELNLTGTLQEVLPQILALNPNWEPPVEVAGLDLVAPDKELAKELFAATRTTTETPSLVKRYFKNRPTCGAIDGTLAEGWVIITWGIPWLRAIGEAGVMCGAESFTCAKCYCEYGSKIELCNVRTTKVDIRCDRLSGAAGEIVKDCGEWIAGDTLIKGHWWDTTNYAAVVRRSNSGAC
ncbi:hypothetical protein TWF569_010389 [Orbilia oligospora]|uniref:Uncharacterized protein n=1 Tax=Orbilia oligospora TaxID=2813651 RepID=A0A7C8NT67_ORBOL|nr:hypothetical protein TWF706_006205 [Orbilia oligospora]KAF3126263.1 hypothetical protein TWF703_010521 [Orbilia oligospora]KAF3133699.1 hypothetical protein TWF569_010389 [Orbilia oligospora]